MIDKLDAIRLEHLRLSHRMDQGHAGTETLWERWVQIYSLLTREPVTTEAQAEADRLYALNLQDIPRIAAESAAIGDAHAVIRRELDRLQEQAGGTGD